jgi:hypothetical protein
MKLQRVDTRMTLERVQTSGGTACFHRLKFEYDEVL